MKVKIEINTGFVEDGGTGAKWNMINLSEETIDEFRLKRDTLEPDMDLEEFIVQDISSLVSAEIENGLYGLFNY